MALKLAEMGAFLQKRQAEEERIQQQIQDAFKELNKSVAMTVEYVWNVAIERHRNGTLVHRNGTLIR